MNRLLSVTPDGGCRTKERQGRTSGFSLQPNAVMMTAQGEKLYLRPGTEAHISPEKLIADRRHNRMAPTQRLLAWA
ncbi:hypothetical protein AAH446_04135 [Erwinia sp. P6884]|uniref:hypothetical protein n=1 Tax=Erwinia sp. P6884 TaxID=3141450 RepID=UPI00319A613B